MAYPGTPIPPFNSIVAQLGAVSELRSALFFFARCQLCHSSESAGVLAQLACGLARPVQLEGGMDTKPSDTRPVDSDLELAVFGAP